MKTISPKDDSLRQKKRLQLRANIQQVALALFIKQGYSNTTVEQIAKVVNVSHMSIFRYFPTKESIILDDNSEELIASLIKKQPKSATIIEKIENAVLKVLSYTYPQKKDRMFARMQLIMSTPDLRAKMWDKQISSAKVMSQAVSNSPEQSFQLNVLSVVCVVAMTVAVEEWVNSKGIKDLRTLVKNAFQTLKANRK